MARIPLDPNNSNTWWGIDSDGSVGFLMNGTKMASFDADATTIRFLKAVVASDTIAGEELKAIWAFRIAAASGIDTDGLHGGLAGCDQVLDTTKTEAGATYCYVWDNSAAALRAIGATSTGAFTQWALLPSTTQDTDACYFGSATRFAEIYLDMSATVQTYTGDATTWEYWNGTAWTALTLHDYTDATAQDGKRSGGRDGALNFLPPSDWAAVAVNSVTGYWIRMNAGTAANISQVGITNSKRHYFVSPTDGFVAPLAGTVTGLAIRDEAGTAHSAADVVFILFNFTQGTHTAALTFPQDKRNDAFADLELAVAAGDVLGIFVTTEDGTNEIGPASIELTVALA